MAFLKSAWALVTTSVICACAAGASGVRPYVALHGGWHSDGPEGVVRRIEGDELHDHARRLGLDLGELGAFPHWWLAVGAIQSTGGWQFRVTELEGRLSLCLHPPSPGAMVTMALQSPLLLLGTQSLSQPVFTGRCEAD